MQKFTLWISLSIVLGLAIVFLMPFDEVTAIPKKKLTTCPPSMTRTAVNGNTDLMSVDRNGNDYVCENRAGKYVDDNKRIRKKKAKKKPKK